MTTPADELMARGGGAPPPNGIEVGPIDVVPKFKEETPSEYLERLADKTDRIARAQEAEKRATRRARRAQRARSVMTTMVEVAGLATVAYGLFTLRPWLGIVFAGLAMILISVLIEASSRQLTFPRRRPRAVPAPMPTDAAGRVEGP